MEKKKSDKNSKGKGLLIIGLILILSSLSDAFDDDEIAAVLVVLVIIIVLAVVLIEIVKAKKRKGVFGGSVAAGARSFSSASTHSHDRLNQTQVVRCTDGYEHWVNQLNGFLAAGIIDRAEYRVLLKKHPRESFEKTNE